MFWESSEGKLRIITIVLKHNFAQENNAGFSFESEFHQSFVTFWNYFLEESQVHNQKSNLFLEVQSQSLEDTLTTHEYIER